MNRVVKGLLIGVGAFTALEVILRLKTGKGIITPSKKKMGEFVLTSEIARFKPMTKAEYAKDGAKFWMGLGDNYTKAYYKAVWLSSKGKATPTFTADGNTYNTKGGKIKN
jgi:hypothetical protein